jgi:tRNA (cytidine/uridine-2'-O-)-methyltransferase
MFHIVLHEPEIPNNTGNIGRTCIATGCSLHLIRPLGFSTDEKACRRAGLDYWPRLRPVEHESWAAYLGATAPDPRRMWMFSGDVGRPVWSADFRPGDHLVFGKETAGLPVELLERHADRVLTFPMVPHERSLNLATAVCAAVYEGVRQCLARGDAALNGEGRLITGRPGSVP